MNCIKTIEAKNPASLSGVDYYTCGSTAKYKVKYIDPIRGQKQQEVLCGRHKRSLEMNFARIKKRTGFDVNLEITEL